MVRITQNHGIGLYLMLLQRSIAKMNCTRKSEIKYLCLMMGLVQFCYIYFGWCLMKTDIDQYQYCNA